MAEPPKLEFEITVPAGGWDISVNDGGGAVTATIPAATYYLSAAGSGSRGLLAELEYQLENTAGIGGAWTVSMADATGLVTIAFAGTYTLTWTDTDLRDALGWEDNIPSGASATGTFQATHLWLPTVGDSGRQSSVSSVGAREDDQVVTRARSGRPASTIFNRYHTESFRFRGLTAAKTWQANEARTNEAAERVWVNYLSAGTPFFYYTDRTDDTSYLVGSTAREYVFSGRGFKPSRMKAAYDSLWDWTFSAYLDV